MTAAKQDAAPTGGVTEAVVAPLPRWKKWLFVAILLTVVLLILQLAAYAYLRAFSGYDGQHLMQYEFDPYKNILPTRNYVDTRGIRHNSVGFRRSSEVAVAKPAGTIRIFLMGGSAAYGLGGLWPWIQKDFAVIKNEETIDAHLERRLSAAFPGRKIEVINAAITSTWTHHSLVYLYQSILKYEPDIILFLDGFNDFYWANPNHDQFQSYSYNLLARKIEGPPTLNSLVTMNGWWMFRKFALAHVVGRAAREAKLIVTRGSSDRTPFDVPKRFADLQQVFPRNAGKVHERIGVLLKHEGVDAVFMLQPLLVLERDRATPSEIEKKMFDFNVNSYVPKYEEFMKLATPWLAAQEQAMANRVGATFIDLTGIYKTTPGQMYTDYCHLTPLGNDVMAAAIVPRITPLIQARITRR